MTMQADNATKSVAQRVAEIASILEEDIVLGVLLPAQRLVEDELMARFEVKRHVVRDALAQLEQMGLIERKRNVGAMVRSVNEQEVLELYELRSLLECEAMRRMPLPVAPEALTALKEIQNQHDLAVSQGDQRNIFRSNQAFHERLYGLCGNRVLAQAIHEYARRTHGIRFSALTAPEQQQRSRRDHHEILKALQEGRRDTLIALVHAHLMPSRDRYLALSKARQSSVRTA